MLSAGFWRAFSRDVAALAIRGDLRAVIVSAKGEHFCAGMDLEAFAGDIPDPVSPSARL